MKRLAALGAVGILLLSGCAVAIDESGSYHISDRSDDESEAESDSLYNAIVEGLEKNENKIQFNSIIKQDQIEKVVQRVRKDHPDYFWIDGYTIVSGIKKTEITFDIINEISADDLTDMRAELSAVVDSIIAGMPEGLDDYGKTVYIHDYIIMNTEYDQRGADSGINGIFGTAYGCLVEGAAICEGYSKAFQYIMDTLGIESGIVSGTTVEGSHAWNYVNLSGKYYWLDLTWDDPVAEENSGDTLLHTYCLIDDERLLRTRVIDKNEGFVPHCYSMDSNYYVKNKSYVTLYSDEALSEIFRNNADNREAEIMFADENAYNMALEELFTNQKIWELDPAIGNSGSIDYTVDEKMYILKISY